MNKLIKSHSDFQQPLDPELEKRKKSILRYIILYYDKNTPLRIMFSDEWKRKIEAAEMAGFKIKQQKRKLTPAIQDIMICKNPAVNRMIVRYVIYFYDQDYMRLTIFKEMYAAMARGKIKADSVSSGDIKAVNELAENISNLQRKLFGGNESRDLREELYKVLEEDQFDLHPDKMPETINDMSGLLKGIGEELNLE